MSWNGLRLPLFTLYKYEEKTGPKLSSLHLYPAICSHSVSAKSVLGIRKRVGVSSWMIRDWYSMKSDLN